MIIQKNLFEDESFTNAQPVVSGLSYIPDFIDSATESALIKTIDTQPWITELKRRVQHYGWRYDYKARSVTNDLRIGKRHGQCGDNRRVVESKIKRVSQYFAVCLALLCFLRWRFQNTFQAIFNDAFAGIFLCQHDNVIKEALCI